MNFPIHDNFGEIDLDQRQKHLSTSVTPEEFIKHSEGKSLNILRVEGGVDTNVIFEGIESENGTEIVSEIALEQALGPEGINRYVRDPSDPGNVIDMRHFLEAAEVGFFGEYLGAGVEIQQYIGFATSWRIS